MEAIYLSRGSSTRTILHCRNWISGRKKVRKEGRQKESSSLLLIRSAAMQMKQNLSQIQRNQEKVKYQSHWRPEQDAVCWIHLSTAQDAGLELWQTGSNAKTTNQSVPKECVVKVVSESGNRKFARETAHTSRTTNSDTQTFMGSYEIQYCKHVSGNRQ